ncbi:MAG: DEAD/DEAH box helicase [Opitutales bacterium]
MQAHGPKRSYNLKALESWFGNLADNWEEGFSLYSLETGRALYREGAVREVELGLGDAIIHVKMDGEECYSVIDWKDGKLLTRSSSSDHELGEAIAIAGLYEIEELVTDEISPLPVEEETESGRSSAGAPKRGVREKGALSTASNGRAVPAVARPLTLRFLSVSAGLQFQAFWRESASKMKPAVLNGKNGTGQLHAEERESLIRLTALAHKAQFRFSHDDQAYCLSEMERVPVFLKKDLPVWRRHFPIELTASAEKMAEGVHEVEVEAFAEGSGNERLNLQLIFRMGEKLLPEKDAEKLLRSKGEPILLPEFGLLSLPREKTAVLKHWRERFHANGSSSRQSYLLYSLFCQDQLRVRTTPELERWRRGLQEPPAHIDGLPDFLRSYQKRGVEWMAHLCSYNCHGLLADEMGLGKTVQVITLLVHHASPESRQLVVGPASVIPVWESEIKRFFPELAVHILRTGNDFVSNEEPGVWLASYTQLRRHRELLPKISFGYAVLDEGQMIKNPDTKITQACFSIQAHHRLVLTGTPLENSQLDLWSLFHFLMPGLLDSRSVFEEKMKSGRQDFLSLLRMQLAPFILRRTKSVVAAELPPKMEMDLVAPLTAMQRREYGRLCREGIRRLGDNLEDSMREHSFTLFSLLTRLRQACCDPNLLPWVEAPIDESGKIQLLLEKLPQVLEGGHKVVIFSQFVRLLERVDQALENACPGIPRYMLHGSKKDRRQPVHDFQEHDGSAVILVSLRAGGTGITLHAADYLFLLDPWWNPAVEDQAVDRVHRIGQKNTVFVYRMVTAGTIEEKIQALKAAKKDLFKNLIGRMDNTLDIRKDFASLRDLIELGPSDNS